MESLAHSYLDKAGEETRLVVETLLQVVPGTQIVAVVTNRTKPIPGFELDPLVSPDSQPAFERISERVRGQLVGESPLGAFSTVVHGVEWGVLVDSIKLQNGDIVGALIVPDAGGAQFQLLVMLESDSGLGETTHHYRVYAINPTTTVVTQVLAVTGPHMAGIFGSPYPQVTRARTSTFTKAGTPIAVWPSNVSATPTDHSGHVYVYPTPTARTAYGVKDLITPGTQITGQVVCFDNRILVLSGIPYVWPGGAISTNENIAFTTPPESRAPRKTLNWL